MSKQDGGPADKAAVLLRKATDEMADLNAFYAIIAICENRCFHTPQANRTAMRIVDICKRSAQTRLENYDRAMLRAREES